MKALFPQDFTSIPALVLDLNLVKCNSKLCYMESNMVYDLVIPLNDFPMNGILWARQLSERELLAFITYTL